ncbi:unknown [Parasutterella excrementihominis CAG:233]|nr:unknown [Parasutterella excrementihominis CAG:233]
MLLAPDLGAGLLKKILLQVEVQVFDIGIDFKGRMTFHCRDFLRAL